MLSSTILASILSLCVVPCFSANPTVAVSRGITEQELKDVGEIMELTADVTKQLDHWRFTFAKEAFRMLPYALSLLANTRRERNLKKKSEMPIGAVVSISGNGGGIFKLMALLKKKGYTNITIIVIVNPKENESQSTGGDYLAFDEIILHANFNNSELFWLEDKTAPIEYHNFTKLSVKEIMEKMKNVAVLFDGICGGGHGATLLNKGEYKTKDILKEALKILPGICPFDKLTATKIVSHATPSGRTEAGIWVDSAKFVCFAIISTTFPLGSLKEFDVPGIGALPPQNILLLEGPQARNPASGNDYNFTMALRAEVADMVANIEAIEAVIKPTTRWVNIVRA